MMLTFLPSSALCQADETMGGLRQTQQDPQDMVFNLVITV